MDHGSFEDGDGYRREHHHVWPWLLFTFIVVDGLRRSPGRTIGEKVAFFVRGVAFLLIAGWVALIGLGLFVHLVDAVLGI
jgi:hypothetical protein